MIKQFPTIQDLKLSEKRIYRIIDSLGPMTKNEILSHTGGSLSTVSRILNTLMEEGLIIEAEGIPRGSGRRPVRYQTNPDACFVFGAFITTEVYGIGLTNLSGRILEKTQRLLEPQTTPSEIVDFFQLFCREEEEKHGLSHQRILGIGVSTLGPLLKEKGILFHPYHLRLPQWQVVPVRDMVEMRMPYPVTVAQLVETALLSEMVYGAGRGVQRAAYLYLDAGIGCGITSHGTVALDQDDMAGGLGHMIIDLNGKQCSCGNRGCLETFASIEAITDRFRSLYPKARQHQQADEKDRLADVWKVSPDLQPIAEWISGGELKSLAFVDEIAAPLAAGLSNLTNLIRPQIVFYGGRTVEQLEIIFHRAKEKIKGGFSLELMRDIRFLKSRFDDELLIRGGGLLAMDRYLDVSKPLGYSTS